MSETIERTIKVTDDEDETAALEHLHCASHTVFKIAGAAFAVKLHSFENELN